MTDQERNTVAVNEHVDTDPGGSPREPADERPEEMAALATDDLREEAPEGVKMNLSDDRDTILNGTEKKLKVTNDDTGRIPWMAVGISVGFGFQAGMMIGTRRDG